MFHQMTLLCDRIVGHHLGFGLSTEGRAPLLGLHPPKPVREDGTRQVHIKLIPMLDLVWVIHRLQSCTKAKVDFNVQRAFSVNNFKFYLLLLNVIYDLQNPLIDIRGKPYLLIIQLLSWFRRMQGWMTHVLDIESLQG